MPEDSKSECLVRIVRYLLGKLQDIANHAITVPRNNSRARYRSCSRSCCKNSDLKAPSSGMPPRIFDVRMFSLALQILEPQCITDGANFVLGFLASKVMKKRINSANGSSHG